MSLSPAATVRPARSLRGRLEVPGDKSIAHRYALFAALAHGPSLLHNFAPGADCRSTLNCLRRLGVSIEEGPAGTVSLLGRGLGQLRSPAGPLDAGNSGTTMRLLSGVLAGHAFSSTLVGDASLSRRPMRRVIEPLERMGARLEAVDGHPPLTVHGARLKAIAFQSPTPSAQVKSAVLLAGLHAEGVTSVTEPASTRDHTERALTAFGGASAVEGLTVSVAGGQQLVGRTLTVPGDFSSAAFWLVAAAALPGSRVEIEAVGLNPTRTRFLACCAASARGSMSRRPRTRTASLAGRCWSKAIAPRRLSSRRKRCPGLIDELPAIAALAAHGGEVTVRGAGELRVKESDRISALVAGFRALGIDADERDDGFVIRGRSGERPKGGVADARGDHRMAMAFAIAALAAEGPSTIDGAEAVDISYPGFFETLERLVS
jgi:3-phosphoshikimate 1-carboxyvinyltransferase